MSKLKKISFLGYIDILIMPLKWDLNGLVSETSWYAEH